MKKFYLLVVFTAVMSVFISCNKDEDTDDQKTKAPIELTFTSASVIAVGNSGLDFRIYFNGDGCQASFFWSGSSTGAYSYDSDPSMMYTWHSGSYSCSEGSGSFSGGDLQVSRNGANFACTSDGRSVSGVYNGSVSLPGGSGPVK